MTRRRAAPYHPDGPDGAQGPAGAPGPVRFQLARTPDRKRSAPRAALRQGLRLGAARAGVSSAHMTLSTLSGRKTVSWFVRSALVSALLAAAPGARAAGEATPAAWTKARSLCDAGKLEEGWKALVQLERSAGKQPLPAAYWREVLACASKANLPANALRAGKKLDALKQATAEDRTAVAKMRAAVRVPEPEAVIPAEEAWIVRPRGNGVLLVNGPCGFAFEPRNDHPFLPHVQQRACSVRTWTPPLKGKGGELRPGVIVLARVAKAGEKLEDYAALMMPTWKPARFDGFKCPGARCLTFGTRHKGVYGKDGDGVGLAVAFERDEPEFPGLLFEDPGPTVARKPGAPPVFGRFRGKIHYLVMFDSAATIAERAKPDYRKFLADLRVE